jgi:hypothetical protein
MMKHFQCFHAAGGWREHFQCFQTDRLEGSTLHRRVNEFANDPDQCFDDEENFPAQGALNGRYYIEGECHEGNSRENCFRLWVQVRCLEKSDDAGAEEGQDYLGLEAIVTVERDGSGFEFDEGLTTSSI